MSSSLRTLSELIEDGKEGLVVLAGDAAALVTAFSQLLGQPALRKVYESGCKMKDSRESHVTRLWCDCDGGYLELAGGKVG
jgi:hypothetical protein